VIKEVEMRPAQKIVLQIFLLLFAVTIVRAGDGGGEMKIGYIVLDEEGNRSANFSTYNQYEGVGVSLENFRYNFDSGVRVKADLKNVSLKNRNLSLGLDKPGTFGLRVRNSQYRRIYNFDGDSNTRRDQIGGTLWFQPHRTLRLFGGGSYIGTSGSMTDLFNTGLVVSPEKVDYNQTSYKAGIRFNYEGRMFQAEYRSIDYNDKENSDRDQRRFHIRLNALTPVPQYEWVILSGGFRHFETEYDATKFRISSNTAWAGGLVNLPENFSVKYSFIFDRTSSDSDFVATDNLTHTLYLSHLWPRLAEVTVGYQNHINDDFEDEVSGNSFYVGGWLKPAARFEFRGEFGISAEEVTEGSRLLGDEDRTRFRLSAKYRNPDYGALRLKLEGKHRKNDQLGTEADFIRMGTDVDLSPCPYSQFSGGYSYSTGDYQNVEEEFEFTDHVLHGEVNSREYKGLTAGFGGLYYRSKRDLDVESFSLRFTGSYRLMQVYRIEAIYNVHNFDDFLVRDQYYTANIVEINLSKEFSF